jgi:predicted MPP superfamily phosphohydrolase
LWVRLVSDPAPAAGLRRVLSAAFVALFLSIPFAFYASRLGGSTARKLGALPGYVWIGTLFILFMLAVSLDVVRLVGAFIERIVGEVPPADPERRTAIARVIAGVIAVVGGGAALAALRSGFGPVIVKEVRVKLARLPKALSGLTIVQVSDIHVGSTIDKAFMEDLVQRVNALSPDVIAVTGDLMDGSVEHLRQHVAPVAKLKARFGTFFVTGNHEYYSGAEEWCAELAKMGLVVLRNERVSIGDERGSFDLAGVDDHDAARHGGVSDVAAAVRGRDPSRELVLLAHQPRSAFAADAHGVGLQLSGHTHGGQIWPWKYFVYLQQPVVAGLGKVGKTLVYVSNGTGYWGPPMRLDAPAEITRIVLESGAA